MLELIEQEFNLRERLYEEIRENYQSYLYTVCVMMQETLCDNGKIVFFGSGKDMEVSKLFADELMLKFADQEIVMPSIALNSDSAISKAYSDDRIFQRQIMAIANSKDMLIGIVSSSVDKSVLRALSLGKNMGCRCVGFCSEDGDIMSEFCDLSIAIPSTDSTLVSEIIAIMKNIILRTVDIGKSAI